MTVSIRQWSLEVVPVSGRTLIVEGHRVVFSAHEGGSSPGCKLTMDNPPPGMVDLLAAPGTLCRWLAGTDEAVEVARGEVVQRSIQHATKDATHTAAWEITPYAGQVALTTLAEVVSGPVGSAELIETVRKTIGLAADVIDVAAPISYQWGYVLEGSALRTLQTLVREAGSQMEIVAGRLRVWPLGKRATSKVDVWTSDTGLLSVQRGYGADAPISASVQLRPAVRVGDVVRIESDTYTGDVIVREVTHSGDTRGDSWQTTIIGAAA